MAKKNSGELNVWALTAIASLLLVGAWLMKSFPVLIFAALSPLLAISDQVKTRKSPWSRFELILLALTIGLWAASTFNISFIAVNIIQAIVITLAFVAYAFAYQNLGPWAGKFIIIFFWLALEYCFLKIPLNNNVVYLADALLLQPSWYNWTTHTGYLGVSLWILITNLLFYQAIFKKSGFNVYYFIAALLLVIVPIIYSMQVSYKGITHQQMAELYSFNINGSYSEKYSKHGEMVARTAAWVSLLIILLSFVKNYIRKK